MWRSEETTLCHQEAYVADRKLCKERNQLLKKDTGYRLDQYVGQDELIRVGDRITRVNVPCDLAHPVFLPKESHVIQLVIDHFHKLTFHSDHNFEWNKGLWLLDYSRQGCGDLSPVEIYKM